jgi:hypothetical protein
MNLSHPNGWEGVQQEQTRRAAIMAGLVPNTGTGSSRIRFVTIPLSVGFLLSFW